MIKLMTDYNATVEFTLRLEADSKLEDEMVLSKSLRENLERWSRDNQVNIYNTIVKFKES